MLNNPNKKLNIYCCYHKHDKFFTHIKQMRISSNNFDFFYGPSGLLNKFLSEFSMFHYIWKNDKISDYIGTCHYRRFINPSSFNISYVNNESCQIYEIINDNQETGIYGIKSWCSKEWMNCEFLWEDYVEYTIQKYGDNNIYLQTDKLLQERKYPSYGAFFISRSTFILTRTHFLNLCEFIFGFLDYINNKYKLEYNEYKYTCFIINWYSNIKYKGLAKNMVPERLLAYFFEWMCSIYIQANLKNFYLIK